MIDGTSLSLDELENLTRAIEDVRTERDSNNELCGCHLLVCVEEMLHIWDSVGQKLQSQISDTERLAACAQVGYLTTIDALEDKIEELADQIEDAEKVLGALDNALPRFFKANPACAESLSCSATIYHAKWGYAITLLNADALEQL